MAVPGSKTTGRHAQVEQAYQKALCNQLWGLQRKGILCDVTLQVEGELIGVHGAVLSSSSTYLKDLCVQLRTMPNPSSRVIQIHHSTVSVCQKMIEYLYTGRSSQFTAEERQDFTDLCLSWMVPNPTDYENITPEAQGGPSPAKKAKTMKNALSPSKTWTNLAPLDELEDSLMKETGENNDFYTEANETPEMGDSDNDADEGRVVERSELLTEDTQEKCDLCHIIFYNKNLLVAHNVEFHYQDGMELPQEYVCTVPSCEYKTFYSKAMAAHENYHYKMGVSVVVEPTQWKCTECGRRCSNEASLKAHQETHQQQEVEPETHMCDLCGKIFTTKIHLKSHVKRVHDARDRLVCPQCGYNTVKADIMKEHMFQKHDILPASGKLIQCEHCDHQSTGGRFSATHSLKHTNSSHISQFAIGETEEWIASILFEAEGPNLFSCPMCPVLKFKPCRIGKLASHLENTHDKLSVRIGDIKIVPCYELCHNGAPVAHYHCTCGRIIRQRKRMMDHVKTGRGHTQYRAGKRLISKAEKEQALIALRKERGMSASKKVRKISAPQLRLALGTPRKILSSSLRKIKPKTTTDVSPQQTVISVPTETVTEEVVVTEQQLQYSANTGSFSLQDMFDDN